ncbi:LysM peptidoglycan-binding domain-containing protein [Paenibacillus lignilyticus]|uniref:LysM peptidoglycan-binding domain-containing protein n=1 Tax=Paenibacillus lignilyticus TaxID=1172615 RepID=A0ABS5C842_9BACL|nr:LysM peptidoglycan-binding domain-containing protein [Paenibacillus lignilyticus]MBP3961288.1 LysM peptidoglycan-binding domain-containing protein [Paenibacillus lignilyticus]
MALKKAKIIVTKGTGQEQLEVLFNPSEYSLESANNFAWQTIPGLQTPIAQFISGEATTLSMDLFFDTYEKATDVRLLTAKVSRLLDVDKDLHAPPSCRFVWGSLDFKGVVERVSQKFTMFLDSGLPVRATLNVTFRALQSMKEQYQNIPRQSADRTKQKTLKQGDQLWMIAAEEYEDPGEWRAIAEANGIDNPRQLRTGRKIIVPRLD